MPARRPRSSSPAADRARRRSPVRACPCCLPPAPLFVGRRLSGERHRAAASSGGAAHSHPPSLAASESGSEIKLIKRIKRYQSGRHRRPGRRGRNSCSGQGIVARGARPRKSIYSGFQVSRFCPLRRMPPSAQQKAHSRGGVPGAPAAPKHVCRFGTRSGAGTSPVEQAFVADGRSAEGKAVPGPDPSRRASPPAG